MAAILFITAFSLKALADETPGDTTPAETTGTETPEGEEGGCTETVDLSDFAIEYNNFRINCVKGVYFQFVKKEEPGTVPTPTFLIKSVAKSKSDSYPNSEISSMM